MKATVLYHSKSGNTQKMAEIIIQGMMSMEGVEAKAFSIDDIDSVWHLKQRSWDTNVRKNA